MIQMFEELLPVTDFVSRLNLLLLLVVEVGGTRQILGHSFKSLPHRIFPIDFDPREEKIPEIPTLVQK